MSIVLTGCLAAAACGGNTPLPSDDVTLLLIVPALFFALSASLSCFISTLMLFSSTDFLLLLLALLFTLIDSLLLIACKSLEMPPVDDDVGSVALVFESIKLLVQLLLFCWLHFDAFSLFKSSLLFVDVNAIDDDTIESLLLLFIKLTDFALQLFLSAAVTPLSLFIKLFTLFDDDSLLLFIFDALVALLWSPPELLLDSLSSAEKGNSLVFLFFIQMH